MLLNLRFFIFNIFSSFFRTTQTSKFKQCGHDVELNGPLYINPTQISLGDHTRLQSTTRMIVDGGYLNVGKYTAIGAGCTIIPANHIPTVGLPQFLSYLHINDSTRTITVGEDCWIGAGSWLLYKSEIGRGAVIGACSVVTKYIPPYAVVSGNPAKIIATRFTIEQILEHEAILYPPQERMSREELESIFSQYYEGKRSIGTSNITPEDLQKLNSEKQRRGITIYE